MSVPDLHTLVHITKNAAQPIKTNFRQPRQVLLMKPDGTPVTNVDMAVHQRFLNHADYRNIGYIGEEGDRFDRMDSYALYVDPLDGTAAYLRGIPTATVAVSLMKPLVADWWEPIIGIIHDPINDWTWAATNKGQGFMQYGPDVQHLPMVKPQRPIGRHRVTAVAWRDAPHQLETVRMALEQDPTMDHQSYGATAIIGGMIATGHTDAVLFGGKSAVETAAMSLIVRAAGGVATTLYGIPLDVYKLVEDNGKFDFALPHGSIMSSSKALTDRLVNLTKRVNKIEW